MMKARNLTPGPDTYAVLLQSYAEHKNGEKIAALLKECDEKEIKFTDKSILDVVCIFADKKITDWHYLQKSYRFYFNTGERINADFLVGRRKKEKEKQQRGE